MDLLVREWGEEYYRDSETTLSSLLQSGRTALMEAIDRGYLITDIVRLLLAQGANVNLQDSVS